MTQAQIHLFTGENAYALRTERQRWEQQFTAKHGQENLVRMDGHAIKVAELLDEVAAAPFIAEKRLLVVTGLPGFSKEQVQALPDTVHPDVILLITDPKPDKRKSEVKAILDVARVREFPVLAEAAAMSWLQQHATATGVRLERGVAQLLYERLGADQDAIAHELAKLSLLADGRPIGFTHVEALTLPSAEQEVWTLTSLTAAGKAREALAFSRGMTDRGEDPYGLWSILLWSLKNLGNVWAAVQDGIRGPGAIAKEAGVPFPSAKSLLAVADRVQQPALASLIGWAAEADVDLKTGALRSTQEAPEEILSLVDMLALRMAEVGAT